MSAPASGRAATMSSSNSARFTLPTSLLLRALLSARAQPQFDAGFRGKRPGAQLPEDAGQTEHAFLGTGDAGQLTCPFPLDVELLARRHGLGGGQGHDHA